MSHYREKTSKINQELHRLQGMVDQLVKPSVFLGWEIENFTKHGESREETNPQAVAVVGRVVNALRVVERIETLWIREKHLVTGGNIQKLARAQKKLIRSIEDIDNLLHKGLCLYETSHAVTQEAVKALKKVGNIHDGYEQLQYEKVRIDLLGLAAARVRIPEVGETLGEDNEDDDDGD